MFPTAQGGADVKAIADAILARKRRPHPIPLVVEKLAFQQSTALREFRTAPDVILLKLLLHAIKGLAIKNCRMLSFEPFPFATVVDLAKVDAIFDQSCQVSSPRGASRTLFLCQKHVSQD